MNTEQLEELYTTSEWICVATDIECGNWGIVYFPQDYNFSSPYLQEYKLVHKKHSEVLDHVLNGGMCKVWKDYAWHMGLDVNKFVDTYHQKYPYEIIKDKPSLNETDELFNGIGEIDVNKLVEPSLNGHYCLATKEHYDKLVEDGYTKESYSNLERCLRYGFIRLFDDAIRADNKATCDFINCKPMHLHNNEWVFGFLTHEEHCDSWTSDVIDNFTKPKPVECIELSEKYQNAMYRLETSEGAWISDDIQKYVSYLEANQKYK